MRVLRKLCIIMLCLAVCTVTGCTKGSSTQKSLTGAEARQGDDGESCVMGIIADVDSEKYSVNINSASPEFQMVADKCGTDYKKGDSVKVKYSGELHHYDENMNRLLDDQFPLTGDKMYIIAEEYTEISLWENDCSFYGTLEYIADIRDENGWFGDSVDTYFSFVPLKSEDEGAANEMFGQVGNIFNGYGSQINDGNGLSRGMAMHTERVKITYDPETMLVTKVEPASAAQ
ncbi:MAG: hypothetical protein NC223_04845 [Butyrivibrio sp.]|nr:hypothetical protein [Butyrivibrio sp.]